MFRQGEHIITKHKDSLSLPKLPVLRALPASASLGPHMHTRAQVDCSKRCHSYENRILLVAAWIYIVKTLTKHPKFRGSDRTMLLQCSLPHSHVTRVTSKNDRKGQSGYMRRNIVLTVKNRRARQSWGIQLLSTTTFC